MKVDRVYSVSAPLAFIEKLTTLRLLIAGAPTPTPTIGVFVLAAWVMRRSGAGSGRWSHGTGHRSVS